MPQFPQNHRYHHSHQVYWIHTLTGVGKLSGRLRAGRKRGACRGMGSLRRVPASPAGRLWRAFRRRPGARPQPATPAGAGGVHAPPPGTAPAGSGPLRPRPGSLPGPALFRRGPSHCGCGPHPNTAPRKPRPRTRAFLPASTRHLHAIDVHLQLQLFHRLAGLRDLGHVVGHGCGGEGVKSRAGAGQTRRLGQVWVPRWCGWRWDPATGAWVDGSTNWVARDRWMEGQENTGKGEEETRRWG